MERRLAAILAADVVGYSRLMGQDEEGTLARLKSLREEVIQPAISAHAGRVVKLMGDGLLAEFPSVVGAVECAVEIQTALAEQPTSKQTDEGIKYRIGINLGDVIVDGDDIYGDGINVAARIENLTPTGGICISRSVRDQIRDKLQYSLEDLGEVRVKNIARPIRVFRVQNNPELQNIEPQPRKSFPRPLIGPTKLWLAVALLLFFSLAVSTAGLLWREPNWDMRLPEPDRPSIAVLPFKNQSDASSQEYFADGLTDDLITDLSKISGLFVISRNSTFSFKDKTPRISRVAQELGVRFVLTGSVRRSGNRIRVNTRLIDGHTERQLWAERYDRQLNDLFAVQDDLVGQIASALAVTLSSEEHARVLKRPAPQFEAYDLYLQARDGFFSRDPERMRKSMQLYAKAITIDPDFARAYAGYAQLAADVGRLGSLRQAMSGGPARRSAEMAARKALRLDPTLADAHSVLALLEMVDQNYDEATMLARRAVQLDPNSADAQIALAIVYVYAGRLEAALDAAKAAMRLNPRPPPYHLNYIGLVLFMNNKSAEAAALLSQLDRSRIRSMGDAPGEILAMSYIANGQIKEARNEVKRLQAIEPFLNLGYYRVIYNHHARAQDLEKRISALRKAGMPEWPFDQKVDDNQKLETGELGQLLDAKTWKGRDLGRRSDFLQEVGKGGVSVFATATSMLNGKIYIKNGLLCEQYDGFVLGRELCGPVLRNPQGSQDSLNEFVFINPITIKHFALTN